MTIHTRLIEAKLEELGWTQAFFAEKSGMSLRTFQNILQSGEVKKTEHLSSMASVLGIEVAELADKSIVTSHVRKPDLQSELLQAREEIIRLQSQLLEKEKRENESLRLENERLKKTDRIPDKS